VRRQTIRTALSVLAGALVILGIVAVVAPKLVAAVAALFVILGCLGVASLVWPFRSRS